MGKFLLYGLIVVAASSLANWTSLGKSAGGSSYASRGGWVGSGGGFSSSGTGHK